MKEGIRQNLSREEDLNKYYFTLIHTDCFIQSFLKQNSSVDFKDKTSQFYLRVI